MGWSLHPAVASRQLARSFCLPQPTNPTRGWIVLPFGANPWWVCLAAAVPAVLVTILIFMDQQITAVILNRKEYKLKVSGGQGVRRGWAGCRPWMGSTLLYPTCEPWDKLGSQG